MNRIVFINKIPCIKETNLPITEILELLARGFDFNEIKDKYTFLTVPDIVASIEYSKNLIDKK